MSSALRALAASALLVGRCSAQGVNSADLKYLLCPVCHEVAKVLYRSVTEKRKAGEPTNEDVLYDLTSAVCDMAQEEGKWIRSVDYFLSEDERTFKLKVHDERGRCGKECLTVGRACSQLVDAADTEIAEALYTEGLQRADFTHKLCNQLTSACSTVRKPIPNPAGRGAEPFTALTEAEQREELMAQMQQQMGAGGYGADGMMGMDPEMMGGMGDMGMDMGMDDGGYDGWDDEPAFAPAAPPSPLQRLETWVGDSISDASSYVKGMFGGKDSTSKTEV